MATEHQTQGQDNDSHIYASISVWRATPRVSPRHSRNSAEKRSSMDLRFCSVCVWERVCVCHKPNNKTVVQKTVYINITVNE